MCSGMGLGFKRPQQHSTPPHNTPEQLTINPAPMLHPLAVLSSRRSLVAGAAGIVFKRPSPSLSYSISFLEFLMSHTYRSDLCLEFVRSSREKQEDHGKAEMHRCSSQAISQVLYHSE